VTERMLLRLARSRSDVLRCQHVIAEIYNKEYEVVFSDDAFDLDAKIEPWPHRYLMGMVAGELVACVGLYLRDTYVARFGNVSDAEIDALIREANAAAIFAAERKREITKVVVRANARGRGYGRFLLACAHARDFLQMETEADRPVVLVGCARSSIWRGLWGGAGIRTRPLKEFPFYKVHELYRSPTDPMDSRLVIPDLDVPRAWYERAIPGEYEVTG
jgi:GNAT superfamily N-acetyltransferase